MAAAALGNTISDLLGIGSAWYVESFADKLGKNLNYTVQMYITSSNQSVNLLQIAGNRKPNWLDLESITYVSCLSKELRSIYSNFV